MCFLSKLETDLDLRAYAIISVDVNPGSCLALCIN